MEQRITAVTLGVADIGRAMAFYEALGWSGRSPDGEVAFFQAGGMVFALYLREKLLAENGIGGGGDGPEAFTLAHNVRTPEEADAVMAEVVAAGGRITRPMQRMEWGGYSGTFADPDGHAWEVAHNPGWPIAEDGTVSLGG